MKRNVGVRQNPEQLEKLIDLREKEGKTLKAAGKAVGISAERARQILRRELTNASEVESMA